MYDFITGSMLPIFIVCISGVVLYVMISMKINKENDDSDDEHTTRVNKIKGISAILIGILTLLILIIMYFNTTRHSDNTAILDPNASSANEMVRKAQQEASENVVPIGLDVLPQHTTTEERRGHTDKITDWRNLPE